MNIIQMALLGLIAVFGWCEYVDGINKSTRPIVMCTLVGLVLGDLPQGIIIGGTLELAGLCAKRAAMRDVDTRNPDPRYAAFEEELLGLLNDLGTGPQGLGGTTTAFKVNVEFCATHIASLPVAVNINCHAARHAEAEL